MAYVDLNLLRATLAETPEASDFTSIQQRIHAHTGQTPVRAAPRLKGLSARQRDAERCIAFAPVDYIQLVEWSGRICRDDKRGHIAHELPPILMRLGIDPHCWRTAMQPKGLRFKRAIGRVQKLRKYAAHLGCCWLHGIGQAQGLYAFDHG